MDIAELDLSCRTYACLKHAHIDTVEQLTKLSVEDLARLRNMTTKGIEEIREKLEFCPTTVGDRIRESNDSLAEWVARFVLDAFNATGFDNCVLEANFKEKLMTYLNSPAFKSGERKNDETD